MEANFPQAAPVGAGRFRLVVRRWTRESEGVVALLLADPEGAELPSWESGAHIDLHLPGLTRQYSLCGDPSDRRHYRIGVRLETAGRGGSQFVHESLRTGGEVTVGIPRNNFPLVQAPEYLFIAGGIGITPLLPMIAQVQRTGLPWQLAYGGRSRASMAFLDELAQHGDPVLVRPQDEYGLLDLFGLLADPGERHVYCCGPEALLAAVEKQCAAWPPGRLHVERFAAKAPAPAGEQQPFEVQCVESGLTVTVPSGQSMLSAMLAAGVDLNFECLTGTCGTCELTVLDGVPDHRDSVLSQEDRDAGELIFPCVSRARSARLVVEA
ncbi:MAG: ferredoxin [Actinoallomurus sp.]|nr:ferredoxin [Actinoallomurus sp.]